MTRTFAILAAVAIWALPAVGFAGRARQGVAKARSTQSSLAACEAAKERANASHCGPAMVAEKAVGSCACSVDDGGWSCRVRWIEMCQGGNPAKTSRAATSTHRGESKRTRVEACFAAEVEARRQACPQNTLGRDVSACLCEQRGGTFSCLVDQTLWCHR